MKTQNYYLVCWTAQGDSILKVEDGDKLGHLGQFPRTARKPIYDMLSKSKQPTHNYFLTTKFWSSIPSRAEAVSLAHHKMGTGDSPSTTNVKETGYTQHELFLPFSQIQRDSALSSLKWISHCFFRHHIAFKVIKHNKKNTFPVPITDTYWSSWSTQRNACSNLEKETKKCSLWKLLDWKKGNKIAVFEVKLILTQSLVKITGINGKSLT